MNKSTQSSLDYFLSAISADKTSTCFAVYLYTRKFCFLEHRELITLYISDAGIRSHVLA